MDRYFTQTVGTPVLTSNGFPVARISEIVIEPETGKVVGFLIGSKGQNVIAPSDIVLWNDNIFIHDPEDILETGEILKVTKVLSQNIPILRSKVYTKKGLYLGKVYDIGINPKLFVLTKLAVAKNILGFFPYDEKIIAHKNILEIKKDRIVVKDNDATVSIKEPENQEENLKIDIAPSTFKKL